MTYNFFSQLFILLVSLLHFYFMYIEMYLWTKAKGLQTFRMTAEHAQQTKVLAANQGLYNGFLATGLLWSALHPEPAVASQLAVFFLVCVLCAGIYGAISVSRRIFYIQALPAILALIFVGLTKLS